MTVTTEQPQLTDQGIAFTVLVDFARRDCVVSLDALAKLSALRSEASSPLDTFRAFEARINGVARRMAAARVPGDPLRLGPDSFQ